MADEEVGLVEVGASVRGEDLGVRDPRVVVAYRFTMPHIAPWVTLLDDRTRAEVTRQSVAVVAGHVEAWRPAIILLAGRVAAHPSRQAADRSKASL